jgi:hypothetical protein
MKKISTVQIFKSEIFKEQKLTIGLDLGDRWSFYCVRDEAGQIILEQKLPTTPEAMKQTLGKIPRSLIALETGTHSPWVSRLLTELGYEVIVAHAQKVQLITKSSRKDDRHDATGHSHSQEKERPHRCQQNRRRYSLRFSARVLHGPDKDSRAAAHAALSQPVSPPDGADEEQN